MKTRLKHIYNQNGLIVQNSVKEEVSNQKISAIVPVYNTDKYLFKCLISYIYKELKDKCFIVDNSLLKVGAIGNE